ncbi:GrpB family protein [Gemella sp. zg-1178]|nr:GrpB family protein [Gemella sp. zg-1178]
MMKRNISIKKLNNLSFKNNFLEEIKKIKDIPKMPIFTYEHIGSTAINNSLGEEIIDILIVVENLHEINNFDEKRLNNMGYHRFAHKGKGFISYCKIKDFTKMDYNIKLFIVQKDTDIHKNFIFFNDLLKNNNKIFEDYQNFKKENFNLKSNSKEYIKKRDIFIKKILNGDKNAKRT